MPKTNHILNLPEFRLLKTIGFSPLTFKVQYIGKPSCPQCSSSKLRLKAKRHRLIKHEPIGGRMTYLKLFSRKYHCLDCNRYFYQPLPGVGRYQRATERLKQHASKLHRNGISQKCLAKELSIGSATIERWYHHCYQKEDAKASNRHCPRVLGIDEHFFGKGKRFATTLCDLKKHRVFDLLPGRNKNDIKHELESLKGRMSVQVVCMDLSQHYRHIVKEFFPNAAIVADRFHVIRLINHAFMEAYKRFDPNIKSNRGMLAALRKNPNKLTPKQATKCKDIFRQHEAIQTLYNFKQRLHHLLMHKTKNKQQCKGLAITFLRMIEQLRQSPLPPLKKLAKTLKSWKEEIARMWRFTKSNGITEGFHRKMKLIQRNAYGFRNFENYRLRVRVLCG